MKIFFSKLLAIFFVCSLSALAQNPNYPDRQIKIISPFAVGGIADSFAR